MDAKVLENIKRTTLRVQSILDESESLLRELKSRRARTPDVIDQELSEIDGDDGNANAEEEEEHEGGGGEQGDELEGGEEGEDEELEEGEEAKPQLEDLNEARDTETSQEADNDVYVSSDEEYAPLQRESRWSCCCRRA